MHLYANFFANAFVLVHAFFGTGIPNKLVRRGVSTNISAYIYIYIMMMIAFITINSGLVSLIEGLCAQILYVRFEIISGLRSHLSLFFFGSKNVLEKKAVSPRSHPAS